MNKKEAEETIVKLKQKIEYHNRRYYIDAKPEISDYDYDQLLHRLIQLEQEYPEFLTPDSPSRRVGGEPLEEFRTVTHRSPMLGRVRFGDRYRNGRPQKFPECDGGFRDCRLSHPKSV